MSNTLKIAALTVLAVAAGNVYADKSETKGGIKVKTEDGRFEASIGGRIHFDHYNFSEDLGARIGTTAYGSAVGNTNKGATNFRRARMTLAGKAYGWTYKFEEDFTGAGAAGFREVWLGTKLGPGEIILGQHKAFRGMEEMTSSNEITFMERPNTTATGIYASQFVTGAFYKGTFLEKSGGYGFHAASLANSNNTTEGNSFGGRVFYAPVAGDNATLHLGFAYSVDREDAGSANAASVFNYGGRRGVSLALANSGGSTLNGTQETAHVELAGSVGSFTVQGEYAVAKHERVSGNTDADVTAYYAQASYFITGEKKPYKKGAGVYGSPKPNNSFGAVEVALRYEMSENEETAAGAANGCATAPAAVNASITKCEGSQLTLGANWYVNPNVRFMLNYYLPSVSVSNAANASDDEPEAISMRAQFSF